MMVLYLTSMYSPPKNLPLFARSKYLIDLNVLDSFVLQKYKQIYFSKENRQFKY